MSLAGDALDRFVEQQIFYPDPFLIQTPSDAGLGFEDTWLETDDGVRIHGWFVPASSPRALVLFCHGNAGNISHRLDNIVRLNRIGLSVLIFDYRGYGRSEGRITEKGLYSDTETFFHRAREMAEKEGLKLIVFGRSLGGVAAVHVAAAERVSGVILESTFTHLGDMARVHFPVPLMQGTLSKRFNSLGKIGRITAPILFFHGDRDDIVPYRLGRELYESAPEQKEFVTLHNAGHNDTYLIEGEPYFAKWTAFVAGLPEPQPRQGE